MGALGAIANTERAASGATVRAKPRVSIVVLSQGELSDLRRALRVVVPVAHELELQLIVARSCSERDVDPVLMELGSFDVFIAPRGSSRSELSDGAMAMARGDIVAFRRDAAIRDASWIPGAFHVRASSITRVVEREIPQVVQPLADLGSRPGLVAEHNVADLAPEMVVSLVPDRPRAATRPALVAPPQ